MSKIATKKYCNDLRSGSFSGDLTQCPIASEIRSASFIIPSSYQSNQLVQEDDIVVPAPTIGGSIIFNRRIIDKESIILTVPRFEVTSENIHSLNQWEGPLVQIDWFTSLPVNDRPGVSEVLPGGYFKVWIAYLESNIQGGMAYKLVEGDMNIVIPT